MDTSIATQEEIENSDLVILAIEPMTKVRTLTATIAALTIVNQQDLATAATLRSEIKLAQKALEEIRKERVEKPTAEVNRINSFFRGPNRSLDELVTKIDQGILSYRREEERKAAEARRQQEEQRRKEEEERRRKAAEAQQELEQSVGATFTDLEGLFAPAEVAPAPAIVMPPKTVKAENGAGGITTRKVWTFTVENIAQVPVQFLLVDTKAIRDAVNKGERSIPGIRIYQEEQIAGTR